MSSPGENHLNVDQLKNKIATELNLIDGWKTRYRFLSDGFKKISSTPILLRNLMTKILKTWMIQRTRDVYSKILNQSYENFSTIVWNMWKSFNSIILLIFMLIFDLKIKLN